MSNSLTNDEQIIKLIDEIDDVSYSRYFEKLKKLFKKREGANPSPF